MEHLRDRRYDDVQPQGRVARPKRARHAGAEAMAMPPWVQAKLVVGPEDDPLEREADDVAAAVTGDEQTTDEEGAAAEPSTDDEAATDAEAEAIADEVTAVDDEADADVAKPAAPLEPVAIEEAADDDTVQRQARPGRTPVAADWEPAVAGALAGGRPLTGAERSPMERHTGADLGDVRIHTDPAADAAAQAIGARAFTVGNDVAFGSGEYAEGSSSGRRLLAHELTHVVQQRQGAARGGGLVQRQPKKAKRKGPARPKIRAVLLQRVPVRDVTRKYLQKRHDDIKDVLAQFKVIPKDKRDDYWVLVREAKRAATELARRSAIDAGRTFDPDDVKKAKKAFVRNAGLVKGKGRKECIVILNAVLKEVWDDPKQKSSNWTMDTTMGIYKESGRVSDSRDIWFVNEKGKRATGVVRPTGAKLEESVWEAVVEMGGKDPGWSMFGMSVMHGYHAVTLTLDNNNPAKPTVYWSDQTQKFSGGWRAYSKDDLDGTLERVLPIWWDDALEKKGFRSKTVIHLWRLRSKPVKPTKKQ